MRFLSRQRNDGNEPGHNWQFWNNSSKKAKNGSGWYHFLQPRWASPIFSWTLLSLMSNDNVNQKVQFCILLCRRSLEEAQEFRNEELKKGKILLLLAALQLCSSASCQSSFYCTQLYDHLLAKYLGFYGKVVASGKSFILGRGHPFIDTLLTLILQSCLPARKELWLLFSTPHWRMGWVTNSHWLKPARCL